jgi:hypothetical protein
VGLDGTTQLKGLNKPTAERPDGATVSARVGTNILTAPERSLKVC